MINDFIEALSYALFMYHSDKCKYWLKKHDKSVARRLNKW